jgi:hypothetical protein
MENLDTFLMSIVDAYNAGDKLDTISQETGIPQDDIISILTYHGITDFKKDHWVAY